MDLQAIGRRIKGAREALGLTQADLAALVGVTRSAVAQWETGRSGQVGANLALVAAALHIEVGHLLVGRVSDPAERDRYAGLSGNERALVDLYRDCNADDQATLLRLAHRLGAGRNSTETDK